MRPFAKLSSKALKRPQKKASWRVFSAAGAFILVIQCFDAFLPSAALPATSSVSGPNGASSADSALSALRGAFLEGYRAENAGDHKAAERIFGSLVGRYPQLGDYVLFYLGRAQSALGEPGAAEASFRRLLVEFPQSVLSDRARLELAKIALKQSQLADAERQASELATQATNREIQAEARVLLARALIAQHEIQAANSELYRVRSDFPHDRFDAQARELQNTLRTLYPGLVGLRDARQWELEAELLLKEGLAEQALEAVERALSFRPDLPTRAHLTWLEARAAAHVDRLRQKRALDRYLLLAPQGPYAADAMYELGLWYWRADQTEQAKFWLRQVVREFPANRLASRALLRVGRITEEEGDLDQARLIYEQVVARFPQSEAAAQARFRAPWMLYLAGDYEAAARDFGRLSEETRSAAAQDRFLYWQARALEKSGRVSEARRLFARLSQSLSSNYYPALAAERVLAPLPVSPAASARDPSVTEPPAVNGSVTFHLERALELSQLGIKPLAVAELLALDRFVFQNPELGEFVLASLHRADDYYDAMLLAIKMEQSDKLSPYVAERLRYPRAYWHTVVSISSRTGLDPYLLLAVARQESLFNPNARSGSDARGLMQLLPKTARRLTSQSDGQLDLYNPDRSLELGAAELRRLLDRFDGHLLKAVAAYNAGERAVEKWEQKFNGDDDEWVENIQYKETRDYVKKVIGGLREYRMLYASASHSSVFTRLSLNDGVSR